MTLSTQPTATATSFGGVDVIDMAPHYAYPMAARVANHPDVLRGRFTANVFAHDIRTSDATDMSAIKS